MPKNYTENYHLNQWEPEDQVLRADFNADNAAIDAALADKAEQTALDKLEQTVASLSGTVTQHSSTMTKLGNCQIQRTGYKGSGEATRTISLPANTQLVVINGDNNTFLVAVRSMTRIVCIGGTGNGATLNATWGATSLTLEFYSGSFNGARAVCNESGATYVVVTLQTLS